MVIQWQWEKPLRMELEAALKLAEICNFFESRIFFRKSNMFINGKAFPQVVSLLITAQTEHALEVVVEGIDAKEAFLRIYDYIGTVSERVTAYYAINERPAFGYAAVEITA